MPYDANGRGITQEEAYQREKWEAKHKMMGTLANIVTVSFLVMLIIVGFIGTCAFLFDMWESGEAWRQALSLIGAAGLIAAIVISIFFTRFEI